MNLSVACLRAVWSGGWPSMLELLDSVAVDLAFLAEPPLFLGASVLELYVDRSEMLDGAFRPTEDVDVVVTLVPGAAGQGTVHEMEAELRAHGFVDDPRPHRKNLHAFISPSEVPVDVVMDAMFSPEDWALRSRADAQTVRLPSGTELLVPQPAAYLACKVAASRNRERWEGDYYCHDLEDVALLLAGCSVLAESASRSDEPLRLYLSAWADEVMAGETEYGRDAQTVLMSNVPAASSLSVLQDLLTGLVRLRGD